MPLFFSSYFSRIFLVSKNIRLFLCAQFLSTTGLAFFGLFFNLYLSAKGFSKETISFALASGNIAIAVFALPAGWLSSKISIIKVLLIAHILMLVCYVFALSASTPNIIAGAIFLASGFSCFSRVLTSPFLIKNAEKKLAPFVFSLNFATSYLASMIGNLTGGFLKNHSFVTTLSAENSYKITILCGISLSLLACIPYCFMKNQKANQTEKILFPQASSVKKNFTLKNSLLLEFHAIKNMRWNFFLKIITPAILIFIGAGLIVQFMNLYFKDVFHVSDELLGTLMACQGVVTMGAGLLSPLIAERKGRVKTIVFSEALSIPFMILMGFTSSLPVAALCLIARGALMNMASPVMDSLYMQQCQEKERAFLNSLLQFSFALSWAFAALLYGHIFHGNYTASFYFAATLYTTAAILHYTFFRDWEADKPLSNTPVLETEES